MPASRRVRTVRACLVLRVPVTPGCCSGPTRRHRVTSCLGRSPFGVCHKAETYNCQETQSRFERGHQTKGTARQAFLHLDDGETEQTTGTRLFSCRCQNKFQGRSPGGRGFPKAGPSELAPRADSPPRTVGSFESSCRAPARVARPPRAPATGNGNSEAWGRKTSRQTRENARLVPTARHGG